VAGNGFVAWIGALSIHSSSDAPQQDWYPSEYVWRSAAATILEDEVLVVATGMPAKSNAKPVGVLFQSLTTPANGTGWSMSTPTVVGLGSEFGMDAYVHDTAGPIVHSDGERIDVLVTAAVHESSSSSTIFLSVQARREQWDGMTSISVSTAHDVAIYLAASREARGGWPAVTIFAGVAGDDPALYYDI
jgi:hypothetical protein